jgi:hypothetical protein
MFRRLLVTSALAVCLPAYVATASKAAPQTATVSADSDIAMIKGRLKARYVGKDFSKAIEMCISNVLSEAERKAGVPEERAQ